MWQAPVVQEVVFNAVIDIRDLADVKLPVLQLEVLLQLAPAIHHQLQCLLVIQHHYTEHKVKSTQNRHSSTAIRTSVDMLHTL